MKAKHFKGSESPVQPCTIWHQIPATCHTCGCIYCSVLPADSPLTSRSPFCSHRGKNTCAASVCRRVTTHAPPSVKNTHVNRRANTLLRPVRVKFQAAISGQQMSALEHVTPAESAASAAGRLPRLWRDAQLQVNTEAKQLSGCGSVVCGRSAPVPSRLTDLIYCFVENVHPSL